MHNLFFLLTYTTGTRVINLSTKLAHETEPPFQEKAFRHNQRVRPVYFSSHNKIRQDSHVIISSRIQIFRPNSNFSSSEKWVIFNFNTDFRQESRNTDQFLEPYHELTHWVTIETRKQNSSTKPEKSDKLNDHTFHFSRVDTSDNWGH